MNGVKEYKLKLDKNTANALGTSYNENDILTIVGINKAIDEMIKTCQTNIKEYILGFQQKLRQTEQAEQTEIKQGGNYKNLGDGESIESERSIEEYKKKLTTIKDKYEQALKDDIKDYKELCDLLTETDGGLLNNINISVQSLRKNSNKLSKIMGLNLDTLLNPDPFAENKQLFVNLINMVKEEKKGLSLNTNIPKPRLSDVDGPVEEKIKEGSQPLKESFERFLDNLQSAGEDDNTDLELYRSSLLDSLKNIDDALNESLPRNVNPLKVNKGYSHHYIAYDFGWDDPNNTNLGNWKVNLENDNRNPPAIIKDYITQLNKTVSISKEVLQICAENIIKLLEKEKSSTEKGATSQGTSNSFREIQNSFKPKISTSASTSGGYKKKSKSKKMTSKKTSMKVAKKTSSKAKENKNIVKSYSKSKSKKQSGGFIRGGVLFPQDFYDTSTVM